MGLFTRMHDKVLDEVRSLVAAGDLVCPSCKSGFVKSGATLVGWDEGIGLEAHRCPHCGHEISLLRPRPSEF